MALKTDANGVITEGRFQGRHIDEVERYLETLEAATGRSSAEPPAAEPPKGKTPEEEAAERLAKANANRVDPLQLATFSRMEQDDEEAFVAITPDYGKYKEKIDKLKATLHPAQRAQKHIHRTLYVNVKAEDPKVRERIMQAVDEEQPPVEPIEGEEPPPPSPGVEPPKPVAARPAAPRPAPPMAQPTPASRAAAATSQSKERKPKLTATEKVKSFCRSTNQNVDAYLLRLEDQGMTQDQLENAGQMGRREEGRRSVYDRKFATRS